MKTALKILLYIILGLFLLLLVVIATLPYSVPTIASKLAKKQGIDFSLTKLEIHWLEGRFDLYEISAGALHLDQKNEIVNESVGAQSQSPLDRQGVTSDPLIVEMLSVDLAMRKLLIEKKLYVESVSISGVQLPVELGISSDQALEKIVIAGIDPADFATRVVEKEQVPEGEAVDNQPIVEFLGIGSLVVNSFDVGVELQSPSQTLQLPVAIRSLDIGEISLQAINEKTAVSGQLDINYSLLNFSGDVVPLGAGREGHLAFKLSQFELVKWMPLAEFIQVDTGMSSVTGELTAISNVEWWLAGDRNFVTLEALDFEAKAMEFVLEQKDQKLNSSDLLQKAYGNLGLKVAKLKLQTNPVNYVVENLHIFSDSFTYVDESLDPPMNLAIKDLQFEVDKVDSQKVSEISQVNFTTAIGRYGKASINGAGSFLDENAHATIAAHAEQLNLSAFSGLAKNAIGKHIDKGALDLTYEAEVREGKLDSEANIEAHQLTLSGNYGANSSITEELGMPLNAALNLLRDKDDTVRLTVPVKGDLHDPQVKIGKIVNKAVLNGIKTAALTQLGPLMALSALDKARTLADGLKLKPVEFDSMSPAVASDRNEIEDRLQAIEKLLKNRPKIRLNVCGFATSRELVGKGNRKGSVTEKNSTEAVLNDKQKKQLYEVATARAENTKDWFLQREIDGRRLILCAPSIDTAPDSLPRVEFSL